MNELKTLQEEGDKVLENEFSGWWDYKSLLTERIEDFIQAERQKSYTLGIMKGVELVEGELPKYPPNSDREELVLEQIKGIINKLKQELK